MTNPSMSDTMLIRDLEEDIKELRSDEAVEGVCPSHSKLTKGVAKLLYIQKIKLESRMLEQEEQARRGKREQRQEFSLSPKGFHAIGYTASDLGTLLWRFTFFAMMALIVWLLIEDTPAAKRAALFLRKTPSQLVTQ